MIESVENGIRHIKHKSMFILVDDQNRENEGDLVIAAEDVTYEILNFMAQYARGLFCVPLTAKRAAELNLSLMTSENTDTFHTAFTVSVDAVNTTTGISIGDRLKTVQALVRDDTQPQDLKRPGHMFPLIAKEGGVIVRQGHTEASLDLITLAGKKPVAVICEILNPDGTMMRREGLTQFAKRHNLPLIHIHDLFLYQKIKQNPIIDVTHAKLPTLFGSFTVYSFKTHTSDSAALVIAKGAICDIGDDIPHTSGVLCRIHSQCVTGDILGSHRCDCRWQLHNALERIEKQGQGLVIYLPQEGRGIGLHNKIKAYALQDEGLDTVEANEKLGFSPDLREYSMAYHVLQYFHIQSVRLLTNNPKKIKYLTEMGIQVVERVPIVSPKTKFNEKYLWTKKEKLNNLL